MTPAPNVTPCARSSRPSPRSSPVPPIASLCRLGVAGKSRPIATTSIKDSRLIFSKTGAECPRKTAAQANDSRYTPVTCHLACKFWMVETGDSSIQSCRSSCRCGAWPLYLFGVAFVQLAKKASNSKL